MEPTQEHVPPAARCGSGNSRILRKQRLLQEARIHSIEYTSSYFKRVSGTPVRGYWKAHPTRGDFTSQVYKPSLKMPVQSRSWSSWQCCHFAIFLTHFSTLCLPSNVRLVIGKAITSCGCFTVPHRTCFLDVSCFANQNKMAKSEKLEYFASRTQSLVDLVKGKTAYLL